MLRLLADENFNRHIVRGLIRRLPNADLVRVHDVGLDGLGDGQILDWAATENRILLTHDVRTIPAFVYERAELGLFMPGVIFVPQPFAKAEIIDNLELLIECGDPLDLLGTWIHLPLR